jgi:transposase-like protein
MRAEILGNVSAAARELGVRHQTLREWIKSHPASEAVREKARESMTERLESAMWKFYQQIVETLEAGGYSSGQLLTGFGIFADKLAMFQRQQQTDDDAANFRSWLAELQAVRDAEPESD